MLRLMLAKEQNIVLKNQCYIQHPQRQWWWTTELPQETQTILMKMNGHAVILVEVAHHLLFSDLNRNIRHIVIIFWALWSRLLWVVSLRITLKSQSIRPTYNTNCTNSIQHHKVIQQFRRTYSLLTVLYYLQKCRLNEYRLIHKFSIKT